MNAAWMPRPRQLLWLAKAGSRRIVDSHCSKRAAQDGAIVLGCAVLAAFGYRGRTRIVGIDLGTTFSVIGVYEDGKVRILPDSEGNLITPSIVHIFPNGSYVVGRKARQFLDSFPQSTLYSSKRFIGRPWSDPVVADEAGMHAFKVTPVKNPTCTSCEDGVAFVVPLETSERILTPQTVGSIIVKHLLSIAAANLGHKMVSQAVIAVPANFGPAQKAATVSAFELAGLKVVRVLEEPTAAAIAYGLHQKPNSAIVLVYDFGGGTLDVALLLASSTSVQVLGADGDNRLGGEDFDWCVSQYIQASLATTPRVQLPADSTIKNIPPCNQVQLEAERVKIALSSVDQVQWSCMDDDGIATGIMTREDFKGICKSLFTRVLDPVHRLLAAHNIEPAGINDVVLVGGTTRIPYIRELMSQLFSASDVHTSIDPDLAVAWGAARMAL